MDIFPLDKVYSDSQKEADRVRRGNYVYQTFKGMKEKQFSESELALRIKRIESENSLMVGQDNIYRQLLMLFNKIAMECNDEDSKEVALMYIWVSEGKSKYSKDCYKEYIEMPFESTTLRAPIGYHEVLTSYYGDYMKVVKGSAIHHYPIYREQEDIYREKFRRNPSRFCFDKDNFRIPEKRSTLYQKQKEMLNLMYDIHDRIGLMVVNDHTEEAIALLQGCQDAAVSIGNTIEAKFDNAKDTVTLLEQYCEKIYEAANSWSEDIRLELDNSVSDIDKKVDELFLNNKKDILFLPCKTSWWESMREVFLKAASDENNRVSVIPIPYFYHDHEKKLGETIIETSEFENIYELQGKITSFDEYLLEKRHPEAIVIQFPYDDFSGVMGISELLKTDNLIKYTDRLIYVPFLNPEPPESTKDVAYDALLELIEQPAVFNSDKSVVASKKLQYYYVEKLVDMTGESMRGVWKDRICNIDDFSF